MSIRLKGKFIIIMLSFTSFVNQHIILKTKQKTKVWVENLLDYEMVTLKITYID